MCNCPLQQTWVTQSHAQNKIQYVTMHVDKQLHLTLLTTTLMSQSQSRHSRLYQCKNHVEVNKLCSTIFHPNFGVEL